MISHREMSLEDLTDVMRIEKLAYSNPWSKNTFVNELRHNNHSDYIVLFLDNKLVAYGGLWSVLDEAHITTIAVDPEYQRQGLGQQMLDLLLAKAVEIGAVAVTLEVRESNVTARRLYERNNFVVSGRRVKYYSDNNEDALVMWRIDPGIQNKARLIENE